MFVYLFVQLPLKAKKTGAFSSSLSFTFLIILGVAKQKIFTDVMPDASLSGKEQLATKLLRVPSAKDLKQ